MRLHFVRHGLSTWNVEKRLQGQTLHPPLTEAGRADASRAAEVLANRVGSGTTLWTSDAVRAQQTANIIGAALGLAPTVTQALREQALGDLEGKLRNELQAEPTPPDQDISEVRWGGGESVEDVYARAQQFLAQLDGENILVSHGDTIRIAIAALEGRGHRNVEWRGVANGEVITLDIPNANVGTTD